MVTGVAVEINKVEGVASTVHLSSQSPGCRETRERREGTSYTHTTQKGVYFHVVLENKVGPPYHTTNLLHCSLRKSVLYICMLGSGCLCVYCAVLG